MPVGIQGGTVKIRWYEGKREDNKILITEKNNR